MRLDRQREVNNMRPWPDRIPSTWNNTPRTPSIRHPATIKRLGYWFFKPSILVDVFHLICENFILQECFVTIPKQISIARSEATFVDYRLQSQGNAGGTTYILSPRRVRRELADICSVSCTRRGIKTRLENFISDSVNTFVSDIPSGNYQISTRRYILSSHQKIPRYAASSSAAPW